MKSGKDREREDKGDRRKEPPTTGGLGGRQAGDQEKDKQPGTWDTDTHKGKYIIKYFK